MQWKRSVTHMVGLFVAATITGEAIAADEAFERASAEQKAEWGQSIFIRDCFACHTVEPENKYGPHVAGLLGRKIGDAEGFKYSDAFIKKNSEDVTWNEENLSEFLRNPQEFAPGNKMWVHVPDEEVVTVLIEYFKSLQEQ